MAQMVCQGVHQRTVIVAAARVHNHARRLVHDQQVVILIYYVQRYILGHDLHLPLRVGHHKRYAVQRLDLVAGLRRHAVDKDIPVVGRRLDTVTRTVLHAVDQKLVQTYHRLSAVDRDGKVLILLRRGPAVTESILVEVVPVLKVDILRGRIRSHCLRLRARLLHTDINDIIDTLRAVFLYLLRHR